jgi:DNA-binding transcriptional MerR regulator
MNIIYKAREARRWIALSRGIKAQDVSLHDIKRFMELEGYRRNVIYQAKIMALRYVKMREEKRRLLRPSTQTEKTPWKRFKMTREEFNSEIQAVVECLHRCVELVQRGQEDHDSECRQRFMYCSQLFNSDLFEAIIDEIKNGNLGQVQEQDTPDLDRIVDITKKLSEITEAGSHVPSESFKGLPNPYAVKQNQNGGPEAIKKGLETFSRERKR